MKKTIDEHGNVWKNVKDFYQLQGAMMKLIHKGTIKVKKGAKKR